MPGVGPSVLHTQHCGMHNPLCVVQTARKKVQLYRGCTQVSYIYAVSKMGYVIKNVEVNLRSGNP